jgi:hypothetical protein
MSFFVVLWVSFYQLLCGSSSVGRATAFQAVGRGFEPRLPAQIKKIAVKTVFITIKPGFIPAYCQLYSRLMPAMPT